ncbi:HK97-gp10 family putative phage morphogenesis protein [Brevundimonas sp.]|uniref:HK97-gp10 family putative phage morphogenesis protein n=1 Tax=Brevundimonas sp. TaxID=1871086 RepID=UPI0025BC1A4A|nr:HK97-gp10 family putative phage morphogenesis protein [Brevundimonas sp.]
MKVRVEGLRDLERAMSELKVATAKNVARRSFKQALEPMAETARALAPEQSRALISTVQVSTRNPKGRFRKESPIEVHMGPGRNPQAVQQEFGNLNHSPQPYMRPAWEQEKKGALDATARILAEEVQKAAKRAARKAARQASKVGG